MARFVNVSDTDLTSRTTLLSSLKIPSKSFTLAFLNCIPMKVKKGKLDLSDRIALLGRLSRPVDQLPRVLRNTCTRRIRNPEMDLCI